VLVSVQSIADAGYSGWDFFSDWTAYTRYLVAIWVMVATERYANGRLVTLADHFREARILPDDRLSGFTSALSLADRRFASPVAEGIILIAVLIVSGATTDLSVDLAGTSWEGRDWSGGLVLSWAGVAARYLSTPLFLFLMLRWVWRFLVWTALLYRISRLPLQLTPLHPDRCAGLGFLAIYPSTFSGFAFALSAVVASAMVKDIALEHRGPEIVWLTMGLWLAFSLGLFIGPLLAFVRPLYALRERALIDYGRLASHHHLAFDRKWLGATTGGDELLGSADPSSAADLNAIIEAVQQLRFIPVDLPALLQFAIAAGSPMIAVVLTQVPVNRILSWLVGTFL
jgi:hypothetical protein